MRKVRPDQLSVELLASVTSLLVSDGVISVLIWEGQRLSGEALRVESEVYVIVEELTLEHIAPVLGTIRELSFGDGLRPVPDWLHGP